MHEILVRTCLGLEPDAGPLHDVVHGRGDDGALRLREGGVQGVRDAGVGPAVEGVGLRRIRRKIFTHGRKSDVFTRMPNC